MTAQGADIQSTMTDRVAPAEGCIEIAAVHKTYGHGDLAIRALEETSLRLDGGDFVSIVGPSGCGKTTLLKIVGDIIPPTAGSVTIDDTPAAKKRQARRIGYVFQNPVLLPWRTVYENVLLPFQIGRSLRTKYAPGGGEELKTRMMRTLEMVGLEAFANRYPKELSGGMRSRVNLARALIYEPAVLLMDEPFAALDELTRTEMAFHLLKLWERVRTTVLFVTHHIEEAVFLSNRIVVMSKRPGEIRRVIDIPLPRPRSPATRRLPEFREIVEELVMDFHTQLSLEQFDA